MRPSTWILILLAACGGPVEVQSESTPSVQDKSSELPAEIAAPTGTDSELRAYATELCRLYTEPSCVDSQRETCPTHLAFPDAGSCEAFIVSTASDCERPIDAVLGEVATQQRACREALRAHDCTSEPFCDAAGSIDNRGACSEVAAAIAQACPPDEDEFGE